MKMYRCFENDDMPRLETEAKVGLVATRSSGGEPHITFLSSLQSRTPTQLMFGQFSEGQSKTNLRERPEAGFLIMTLDRRLWRGSAHWTHEAKSGSDFELYNRKPMFRYNAYFGIHTVHYLDLKNVSRGIPLPLARFAAGLIKTRASRQFAQVEDSLPALNPWSFQMFRRVDALKYLAFLGEDGYPCLVPCHQCQAVDAGRLVFSTDAFEEELFQMRPGMSVAVFAHTMQLESVLVRGVFDGYAPRLGVKLGAIDLKWVYNGMPPVPGQIYPPLPLLPYDR